jgi:thioredoxin 1
MMMRVLGLLLLAGVLTGCTLFEGNMVDMQVNNDGVGNSLETQEAGSGDVLDANGYSDLTDEGFDAVVASSKLVVVFFKANWCPTCRAQEPVNREVFSEYVGDERVAIFVGNFADPEETDFDKEIQSRYGVSYQHTFLFIKNGEEVGRHSGRIEAGNLREMINSYLRQ